MWNQVSNPLGSAALSTIAAALPVVTLLVLIASNKVKAHIAAIVALIVANLVAVLFFTMPAGLSLRATVLASPKARQNDDGIVKLPVRRVRFPALQEQLHCNS